MEPSAVEAAMRGRVVIHPLDAADGAVTRAMRTGASPMKGKQRGIEARALFDALMEGVQPRNDVTFEATAVGGVAGLWVRPARSRPDEAILHLHAGWFILGTASAFRHLVGLVQSYLRGADPEHPLASPLRGRFSDLPPIRIHVGDDEVLLDDSRRYIERAVLAGVDAQCDVWTGMPHGFTSGVGVLKAAGRALDAVGVSSASSFARSF